MIINRIFVLTSNIEIDDNIVSILSKSPKFIPYKPVNIRPYIVNFIRKIQWFHIGLKINYNRNRFGYTHSNKWPNENLLDDNIKNICNKIYYTTISTLKHTRQLDDNLTLAERSALDKLVNNKKIIIRPADKGGNWIVLNKNLYENEIFSQLDNRLFYSPIFNSRAKFTSQKLKIWFNLLHKNKFITSAERNYLIPINTFKNRKFYTLPKIHKDSWFYPNFIPKGRPIVSNSNCESSAAAQFIDYFLQPIVQNINSYIKNTDHFIALISRLQLPHNSILFTMDVTSLYTNVPIQPAIDLISKAFLNLPDNNRPDLTVINMLKWLLYNNDFYFKDSLYLQTKGISMGQRFSPSVANIYMANWEDKLFLLSKRRPLFWVRYIDDIFGIWDGDLQSLEVFHTIANTFDSNIKVTLAYSYNTINFLDTSIYVRSNFTLGYRIYFKPTDNNIILSKSSHHPKHVFTSIVYSQIRRWATRCSDRLDFNNTCKHVFRIWNHFGYTFSFLRQQKRLVLNNLNLTSTWSFGFRKCSDCRYCSNALSTIFIPHKLPHRILGNFTCKSSCVVYCILCIKCYVMYIGQTGRCLFQRISEHLGNIRRKDKSPLYQHFQNCDIKNFKYFAIDSSNDKDKRLNKETRWIERLNTIFPNGLNTLTDKTNDVKVSCILPHSNISQKINQQIRSICENNQIPLRSVYTCSKNLKSFFS